MIEDDPRLETYNLPERIGRFVSPIFPVAFPS